MSTAISEWAPKRILEPDEPAMCVAFSPDANLIVSGGGHHNAILVWNGTSTKPYRILDGLKHRIWCAKFSDSGKWLACGEDDAGLGRNISSLYLFQMPDFQIVQVFAQHQGKISDISFIGDVFLLSAGRDGNIIVWDLESGSIAAGFHGGGSIYSMAIAPDAESIVTSNSVDGKINLWSIESMDLKHTWTVKGGLLDKVGVSWTRKALFLTDEIVIVGHDQQHFTLWNTQTKQRVGTVKHTDSTSDLALSPDKQLLAQIDTRGRVTLWDTSSWQKKVLHHQHGTPFASNGRAAINFSSDGVWMVSAGLKKEIFVWGKA